MDNSAQNGKTEPAHNANGQVTEEAEPQSYDVFDSSEFGIPPSPLAETVTQGLLMLDTLEAFDLALHGCMTPLNMKGEHKEVQEAYDILEETVGRLILTYQNINQERPLSLSFNDGGEPAEEKYPLSPKQVNYLEQLAPQVDDKQLHTTTYQKIIGSHPNAIPQLIRPRKKGRPAGEPTTNLQHSQRSDAADLLGRLLADLLSRECSYCHAPIHVLCSTDSGNIAELPHANRIRASKVEKENLGLTENGIRSAIQSAIFEYRSYEAKYSSLLTEDTTLSQVFLGILEKLELVNVSKHFQQATLENQK